MLNLVDFDDADFLESLGGRSLRLGDLTDICTSLTTSAVSVYIFREGGVNVEDGATRKIVKASQPDVARRIIWPYDDRGRLIPASEFRRRWPKAGAYLDNHSAALANRSFQLPTDGENFHAFTRTAGLMSLWVDKIVTPEYLNRPKFVRVPSDVTFYSGYALLPKPHVKIDEMIRELNTDVFGRYLKIVSSPRQNGWFHFAKRYAQDFPLPRSVVTDDWVSDR